MPMSIPISTSISKPESHTTTTTTIGSCQQTNIPFINKYQPQHFVNFEQLDPNIVLLLNTLIKINNLNLLLIGDPGSGKTSLIYAIIREYYKSNYKSDNILVLNSLKDQGISYYRNDLKIFCQTSSLIPGFKKIVLLDDIDIINEQSQQVFRNCMDKYSHKVHFISSCTNVQKVIDSLQSRNIIIKMNQVEDVCLDKIMKKIVAHENIIMDADAQKFILNISNLSIRILINYLEKSKILNTRIDLAIAKQLCTNISFHIFEEYTTSLTNKDLDTCIKILYSLYDQGYSVMDILDNYFLFVKSTPLIDETNKYKITKILCKYMTIFHNIHEDEIELALFTNNLVELF
jgi:DNA polymerase III delta prime subunit